MQSYSIYILGYSLDSCLYARELADANSNVVFVKTGELGHPFDTVSELINEKDVKILNRYLPTLNFSKVINSTYMFLPYDSLEFVNSHNGLIRYPINKNSFECAEEIEQIESCILSLDRFKNKLNMSNNYINLYKKFFPKWLYDSVLKHVSVNKWIGYKQSKLTKDALAKEINTDFLDSGNTGVLYKPEISYAEICNQLLNHKNIKIKSIDIRNIRKLLIDRQQKVDIILMDNRVDMFCGYSQGKFERMSIRTELSHNDNMEELIDVSSGVVFTPLKDYWCVINDYGNVKKIYSNPEILSSETQTVILPTINNEKTYNDYKKILNLYSGKHLNLEKIISTNIL